MPSSQCVLPRPGKSFTYALGPETFGVNLIELDPTFVVAALPATAGMPEHIRGLLTLDDGQQVPVFDLRCQAMSGLKPSQARMLVVVLGSDEDETTRSMAVLLDGPALAPRTGSFRPIQPPAGRRIMGDNTSN